MESGIPLFDGFEVEKTPVLVRILSKDGLTDVSFARKTATNPSWRKALKIGMKPSGSRHSREFMIEAVKLYNAEGKRGLKKRLGLKWDTVQEWRRKLEREGAIPYHRKKLCGGAPHKYTKEQCIACFNLARKIYMEKTRHYKRPDGNPFPRRPGMPTAIAEAARQLGMNATTMQNYWQSRNINYPLSPTEEASVFQHPEMA